MLYTTVGDVRGCCDHKHRSIRTAVECLGRDQGRCARQGGYSDRIVVYADHSWLTDTDREEVFAIQEHLTYGW